MWVGPINDPLEKLLYDTTYAIGFNPHLMRPACGTTAGENIAEQRR